MTKEEAYEKLRRYCMYQDRCHQEVRSKLLSLKIYGDRLEEIISQLISEGYLNEERFAKNFARGKFRIRGFGKTRITQELKIRRVSDYCIKKALNEIDKEGGYKETLQKHINKFINERRNRYNESVLRKKGYTHGISKGYESHLVMAALESYFES